MSINDELLLSNDYAFWRSVAIVIGVQPTNLLLETARAVLDSLSDWDEDYLSEDGDNLSDEAYSDLLAILNERTMNGARPWRPRDEQLELTPDEDDEDGTHSWEYGVGQQAQPDIRTVLGMLFDKELIVNPEWQRNFVWPIKKQRTGARGYHPLLAIAAGTGEVLMSRLRRGPGQHRPWRRPLPA